MRVYSKYLNELIPHNILITKFYRCLNIKLMVTILMHLIPNQIHYSAQINCCYLITRNHHNFHHLDFLLNHCLNCHYFNLHFNLNHANLLRCYLINYFLHQYAQWIRIYHFLLTYIHFFYKLNL